MWKKSEMKYMAMPLCLFLLLILIPTTIIAKTMLACVGDSITRRGGEKGYVAVLTEKLGEDYDVQNFGVDGLTMVREHKNAYFKSKKFKELFEIKPDIITIMLGTNEARSGAWKKYGDDYEEDAAAMVDTLLTISPQPRLLLALPPHVFKNRYGMSDEAITEQGNCLRAVAKDKNIQIIDTNTPTNDKKYFADGCHLSAEGGKLIADIFYTAITDPFVKIARPAIVSNNNRNSLYTIKMNVLGLSNYNGGRYPHSFIIIEKNNTGKADNKVYFLNGRHFQVK